MIKKGQLYIFTAILLSTLVFFGVMNTIVLDETDSDFNDLYQNYIYEAHNVINNAVYSNNNVSEQMANYTYEFIEYATSKNFDLGILYVIVREQDLRIVNYLNGPAYYSSDLEKGKIVLDDGSKSFQNSGNFSISYLNQSYYFGIRSGEGIQFKALIQENE